MYTETSSERPGDGGSPAGAYAILDQALWTRFREAAGPSEYLAVWLALQCRQLGPDVSGVLLMGEPDTGPFTPVAGWPDTSAPDNSLLSAAQQAVQQGRGVVVGEGSSERILAQPLFVKQQLYGVVAILAGSVPVRTVDLFRRLQWGAGWIEVMTRREQESMDAELREKSAGAFDALATVLEHSRFDEACNALVSELATTLACDRVSVGFVRFRRCRVRALSLSAGFANRMSLMRDIAVAMDEAADQEAVILYPPPEDWEFRVTRAHQELADSHRSESVLTVPLQSAGEVTGALTFERASGEPFEAAEVELADAIAAVVGPVLEDRRLNDRLLLIKVLDSAATQLKRLLGPSYFGRKLATLGVVALAAFLWLAKADYSVSSPAHLQGTIQRTIVSPVSGYLAAQYARAGDLVEEGELLAVLDDQDLALQRLRLLTTVQQRNAEHDRALAERNRAEANIIKAQIEQARAQLALVEEQLARTRIVAPFAGVVVMGDLSQSVGAAVERGQELFQIAPLNAYRVVLEVDERDIQDIAVGQQGVLRVSAMPETPLPYRVERFTPMAQQGEGRNFFEVEAALDAADADLRPGMEGVARTEIEQRRLLRIWGEKTWNWVRLAFWRWLP
ncbi:hypothetical protein GCM10011348_43780 [Marinobacterium nitratireducens]|uniref:GAF domain-containing protein n=1 Tax=Marinobacterium nitratireducens TaxID=518897 RepID=A0A917ZQI4_9GAMM|nr:efflux RND transporter periplasmic adaptor subunit [Marinobacterium nitratireducens]GGO88402.1 hypothetical protein GCM10011348_43780 [Marinobacterium nitratireducens]